MTAREHRCIVYATPARDVWAFARAIGHAEGPWKPIAVPPLVLDAAVEALQPEAVVVATHQPRAGALLRQARQRYGDRRLVMDDKHLTVLTKLLSQAA